MIPKIRYKSCIIRRFRSYTYAINIASNILAQHSMVTVTSEFRLWFYFLAVATLGFGVSYHIVSGWY